MENGRIALRPFYAHSLLCFIKDRQMTPSPFLQPVYFDSCAFDGGDSNEQAASIETRGLLEKNGGRINVLHSVQKEIDYPATPQWVKDLAGTYIQTLQVPLTPQEKKELGDVEHIIAGKGSLEKRKADCRHVFEAQKYGRYFVTTDKEILKHSDAIRKRFTILYIVKPSELLEVVKHYNET